MWLKFGGFLKVVDQKYEGLGVHGLKGRMAGEHLVKNELSVET